MELDNQDKQDDQSSLTRVYVTSSLQALSYMGFYREKAMDPPPTSLKMLVKMLGPPWNLGKVHFSLK